MRNYVLPLILLFGTSALQAQSQPPAKEVAQTQNPGIARDAEIRRTAIADNWVEPRERLAQATLKNIFIERQIALRRDTEKLLALAEELKQNVDKTNPNILSIDVVKKAQEIEKLAKSVKDKMKDAY
ncbi:MAG: hypothetical protein HY010_17960 [Acidobacteria bacterium]|nr:hypothetical protein [Acidobacteriota bacterium]